MAAHDITALLYRWSNGDGDALDLLTPLVYSELRVLARRFLQNERAGHSLRSSDLVHEAYLRLVDQKPSHWNGRTHFFAVCAKIMRRVLVDHARTRLADKRGGGAVFVALSDELDAAESRSVELIALDDTLNALSMLDPQQGRIVELRFFAGLSVEETAQVLNISPSTVQRHWNTARAWLIREMSRTPVKH